MPPKKSLNEKERLIQEKATKKRRSDRDRLRRQSMSAEHSSAVRVRNAEIQAIRRATMLDEERSVERLKDAEGHSVRRATMLEEERSVEREQNVQRKRNKRQMLIFASSGIASKALKEEHIQPHNCGNLDLICNFCLAKHFEGEQLHDRLFTQCCQRGKVILQPIKVSPLIQQLMTQKHQYSKNFKENVRSINSALAFASMGAKIASPPGYGPYCFRINGQIYHRTGALHPTNGDERKFAQLYILDPHEAGNLRIATKENCHCNPELIHLLSNFFAYNNPFAEACKMLYEVEQECLNDAAKNGTKASTVSMAIVQNRNLDVRRYNAPKVNEVAVIFQNADGEPPLERDLLIHCRVNANNREERKTERISVLDPNLEPMVYPILFPYGDQSWSTELPLSYRPTALLNLKRPHAENPRTRVTQMQYYGYRFSIRDEFNPFLSAGKLTQQYFVDAYIKTEANRLNYIRNNQTRLRVENYTGLVNHLASEAAAQGILPGKAVILPSSFQGSPRNMLQNYQDAMAIVRKYGKPDLFLTMTCNPKWPEIQDNLNGHSVEFRPDLVARVFNLKLKELLNDICKKHILGTPSAKVHVIEFQKRGLPHAHILLILKSEDKPKDAESTNNTISAEIPNIQTHPRLHAIVTKHMIHGPCGEQNLNSPCMIDGKCSKNFPKEFQDETITNVDGYPKYRRRNNGRTECIKGKNIDNSWVVPYNSYLCLKYNCHINVESCASIKSIKYLFKYVYKGHDCANVMIEEQRTLQHDEIKSFIDSRYVSAPEAAWRLFGFHMHEQSHTIIRLPIHLPDEQNIYFTEDNIQLAVQKASQKDSMLTAWFKLNQDDESAREILYGDVPLFYVFDKVNGKWKPRIKGSETTIGRMYSVHLSSDIERFCLRLLLLHVAGAKSYKDLRSFNRETSETFKEAAQKRGIFADDATWDSTLADGVGWQMPSALREMFAMLCIMVVPPNIPHLFEKYKKDLYIDFSRHEGHIDECPHCQNLALMDIQSFLLRNGKHCDDFGLPTPVNVLKKNIHISYDILTEKENSEAMKSEFNIEQMFAFETIIKAADNELKQQNCFFLDGPGGSGKTYLYKALICTIRGKGKCVVPVASTGIAANLLDGGRTYHSQFKLPVPLLDSSTSSMRMNSADAELIRKVKLIIWDESTMAPSIALKTVNNLLQDIMQNKKPFGGKTILLGGDFRQTLPVIPRGSRSAIVESSLKFNELWDKFMILKLKNNVRSVDQEFSDWLLKLGNGELTNDYGLAEDIIEIPQILLCKDSLITEIYGEKLAVNDVSKFSKKAILCPKNEEVNAINEEVLNLLDGNTVTYLSVDSIDDEYTEDKENYPVEFLNAQTPSGMPLHKMNLKVGSIIMLLRNLNTGRGLCNGTRLIVKSLRPNLILAETLTNNSAKRSVFIPRIDLMPSNTELPFVLKRRQFPIKLAFAMTINKSQGQTLEKLGIYLPNPVFSHGQLYVAFSRVRRSCDVRIKIVDGREQGKLIEGCEAIFTKNIVYKEML